MGGFNSNPLALDKIVSNSASLPSPLSPQANSPNPGSTKFILNPFNFFIFSCTTGLAYILLFIAGAIRTGDVTDKYSVERRSSAMPLANFPIILAVAGATINRSHLFPKSIWGIEPPLSSPPSEGGGGGGGKISEKKGVTEKGFKVRGGK